MYKWNILSRVWYSLWWKICFGLWRPASAITSSCKTYIYLQLNWNNGRIYSSDLWRKFRLAELDQVMHQDDEMFINLLNKIRIRQTDQYIEHVIKIKIHWQRWYKLSWECFYIFVEKAPIKRHNNNRLILIPGKLITIPAKYEVPWNSKISDIREAQNRKQSKTGGLAPILELKISARIMWNTLKFEIMKSEIYIWNSMASMLNKWEWVEVILLKIITGYQ